MENVRKTEIGQEYSFGYRRPQGKHVLISMQLFYLPPHKIKQNKTKLQHRNNYNTRRSQIDQFLSKQPGERMLLHIAKDLKTLM